MPVKQNRITKHVSEMEQQERIICGSFKMFLESLYS